MKKFIKLFIISIFISIIVLYVNSTFATIQIPGDTDISKVSIYYNTSWNIETDINYAGFKLLTLAKLILQGLLLIFLVYVWWEMIMSMWDNEEKLSSAKRQLWYWLIALIFINIPWTLYHAFKKDTYWKIDTRINKASFTNDHLDWNIFLNPFNFWYTFEDKIIWFLKIWIYASAIIMFIFAAYRVMMSKWNEEEVKKAKNYFGYWILSLIFAWMIDVWKYFIFDWSVKEWLDIFSKLANIALFFAWPIAIFFMTLAWYYYITANWEDEKVKKAKSIIINTILWVLIMLASYSFLLDLSNL